MKKLNPFHEKRREAEKKANEDRHKKRVALLKTIRKDKIHKKGKKDRTAGYQKLQAGLLHSYKEAADVLAKEEGLDLMQSSSEDEQ